MPVLRCPEWLKATLRQQLQSIHLCPSQFFVQCSQPPRSIVWGIKVQIFDAVPSQTLYPVNSVCDLYFMRTIQPQKCLKFYRKAPRCGVQDSLSLSRPPEPDRPINQRLVGSGFGSFPLRLHPSSRIFRYQWRRKQVSSSSTWSTWKQSRVSRRGSPMRSTRLLLGAVTR